MRTRALDLCALVLPPSAPQGCRCPADWLCEVHWFAQLRGLKKGGHTAVVHGCGCCMHKWGAGLY